MELEDSNEELSFCILSSRQHQWAENNDSILYNRSKTARSEQQSAELDFRIQTNMIDQGHPEI